MGGFVPSDASGLVANRVEPGKRPRSSAIIQYVTRSLLGLIDWRLDIQQVVNLPHFDAQTSAVTAIEQWLVARHTHLAPGPGRAGPPSASHAAVHQRLARHCVQRPADRWG
jgi:gamma-glutamyltranspeptidase